MNTWGHSDPEKGTEGAQVYSLLGKELRLEHRAHCLLGMAQAAGTAPENAAVQRRALGCSLE